METEDIIEESRKDLLEGIFRKNEDLHTTRIEEGDLEIFEKIVTPYYRPRKTPATMAIEAISDVEKNVIKTYHQRQFGISNEKTMVASANRNKKNPLYDKYPELHYDHDSFGMNGDARMNYCYMDALSKFKQVNHKFDLIYIRNPDLIPWNNWEDVFSRALEWTAKDGGSVITLIRENDIKKYNGMLNILDNKFGITPVFSGETGICTKDLRGMFSENHQHTIGIFK